MDTKVLLAELSNLAEDLNKETDSYTETLTNLEKNLRKLNLGVEAWVRLEERNRSGNPMRHSSTITELGYAKTSDGWGFAVRDVRVERGYYQGDEDCPWEEHFPEGLPKPLLKSSRELRIEASREIENLLLELQNAAKAALGSVRKAKTVASLTSTERGGSTC
ncbi:MAG TPA: hypothetical protein VG759_22860 [Candidatus Angelobacter sp.]|jgi:hypothetical protein|nr:hypothetical protein [Candidatus Angelobacter sp.]